MCGPRLLRVSFGPRNTSISIFRLATSANKHNEGDMNNFQRYEEGAKKKRLDNCLQSGRIAVPNKISHKRATIESLLEHTALIIIPS